MTPLRAQRIFMGIILLIAIILMHSGFSWGEYIIWFITFMLIFSGITGICPSEIVFGKLFGKKVNEES